MFGGYLPRGKFKTKQARWALFACALDLLPLARSQWVGWLGGGVGSSATVLHPPLHPGHPPVSHQSNLKALSGGPCHDGTLEAFSVHCARDAFGLCANAHLDISIFP